MTSRLAVLAALILSLSLATSAAAQVPPEKVLATMKPADGFQVELFAHEPMLINPTSIDVDHKGRVWVAEAVNYRRKNYGRPIIRPAGDRIVVLIDKNGTGKADEAVTFYQGTDLYGPIGVCVAPYPDGKGQKVFVCQSPDILVFEDKDGDLKADGPPKKFLTGFGGFDHDHGVHGINIGPDGKLYFTVGDAGVHGLQSSDGKGRKWESNNTDCRAGTVWRCDMDGTNLELIAHNFRNNYECCVDSFGEIWLSDNDDDGNQQTRICYVMPGGNYGYNPRGAGQSHWHEEQPGIVHKTLRTGFGSPTGITFYEGTLFPGKYRSQLLHCDAGPREVRAFFRKPKGAGYELDKEVILTSTDTWFRPSDVCVGPDGSIFVADWYDPGVGGHGMGDWTRGRIYRLTPKGHKGYAVPEVKLDTKEGIFTTLRSPCLATRFLGFQACCQMGDIPLIQFIGQVVLRSGAAKDEVLEARLAWVWWLAHVDRKSAFEDATPKGGLLAHDDFRRTTMVRIMEELADHAKATPRPVGVDRYADARREWLLLMRKFPAEQVKDSFYRLAKLYDGQDIFYRAALNIACGTDPARRDAILADFDKHFPEWDDKVADLVWELRPKSVLPRLGTLLADPKLTGPQKARIVEILSASDDPAAGQTMLGLLKSDASAEVKARAIDQLRLFLPTKWKSLQGGKDLASAIETLLKGEKTTITGLQLIAAIGSPAQLDAVVAIATDDTVASDVRKEAIRTLGKLPSEKAVETLMAIGTPENPLSIPCIQALGNHLPVGGRYPLYADKAKDALIRGVLAEKASPPLRSACLAALAGNRAGTIWLIDAQAKKTLPQPLVAEAGQLVRNSPYADLRNRALLAFPAPGKLDPKKLPAIAELARRAGNAERGKQVWAASLGGAAQCAKCHTVRGVGGQVGPDLSMIGKKGSKENLFESILDPSKAIADQYIQHQITTTAEVTVSGLLVAETPEAITLRDANGKDTVIPRKDLDGPVRKLKVSIMPQDIVAALTEDELTDLVAYLATLQTAALTPDSFRIVGPFPAASMTEALGRESGPERATFDPNLKFRSGNEMIAWRSIRPDAKGYFDLAALHGTAGNNSASYMYTEVDSPADQDAEILLGTDDGAKLWVNGNAVFHHEETKAAAPGQHTVGVKLKKGTNAVLLKVANGNNPHGFYFTLLSGQETKAK
jgi:putative membrane-bound dehydrogenase-like protein